jgi:hypothetical protein
MRKAGELGFASVDIPEEYGGMGMDKVTSTLITDHLSVLASFSTAFGAHIGIARCRWSGTAPRSRSSATCPSWPPASGSAAYGLSEASSGSDAMNIRTRATLSPDGAHYTSTAKRCGSPTAASPASTPSSPRSWTARKVLRLSGRARDARPDRGRRGAQAGHSRLLHLPAGAGRTARFPRPICWARPARATTSPSTC